MKLPDNPLARACEQTLRRQFNAAEPGSSQHQILKRVLDFPFSKYPDTTAPWHLLTHDPAHMRWDHVADVIEIVDSLRQPTGSSMGQPITLEPFQVIIVLAFLGPGRPCNEETGGPRRLADPRAQGRQNRVDIRVNHRTALPQPGQPRFARARDPGRRVRPRASGHSVPDGRSYDQPGQVARHQRKISNRSHRRSCSSIRVR